MNTKKKESNSSGISFIATICLFSFIIGFLRLSAYWLSPPISNPLEFELMDKIKLEDKYLFLIQSDNEQHIIQTLIEDYQNYQIGNLIYFISTPIDVNVDVEENPGCFKSKSDLFLFLSHNPTFRSLTLESSSSVDRYSILYPSLEDASNELNSLKAEKPVYLYVCLFSLVSAIALFIIGSNSK